MTYEVVTTELGDEVIKATEPSGKVWWIPQDPANTMYQAYLASLNK